MYRFAVTSGSPSNPKAVGVWGWIIFFKDPSLQNRLISQILCVQEVLSFFLHRVAMQKWRDLLCKEKYKKK